jgi:hypothetical protein
MLTSSRPARVATLAQTSEGWSYADLVVVMLTAVGVLVATLGIGVAILAVWGYAKIAENAVERSLSAVTKRLDDMTTTSELQERIKRVVDPKIEKAADEVYNDFARKYPAEDE